MSTDVIDWHAHLTVRKYDEDAAERALTHGVAAPTDGDFARLGISPYEVGHVDQNLLTTAGITRIVSLLTGGGGIVVSTTTARVGVGNGAGTAVIADADLGAVAGSTNRWFQTCTITTPGNVLTAAATFASADGNFAWNEWGLDIGTATVTSTAVVNATLLNHKTGIAQGTKASGQVWTATATITLS